MFLARKIARAKWDAKQGGVEGEIPADAVTGDLRTQDNTLSFWQCDTGTNGDVEEAALAIAAAGKRVDKLDIVWLATDELQADGQVWEHTAGQTPVADLVERHANVYRLDYARLGKVANRVAAAIKGCQYRRLTKACVKKLLSTAVKQGRIDREDLDPDLLKKIAG